MNAYATIDGKDKFPPVSSRQRQKRRLTVRLIILSSFIKPPGIANIKRLMTTFRSQTSPPKVRFSRKAGVLAVIGFLFSFPLSASEDIIFTKDLKRERLVTGVLSVDTIIVDNVDKIKLIGLKALDPPRPEELVRDQYGFIVKKNSPEISLEERALAFVRSLLQGKEVLLEFDIRKKDETAVDLAYVFLADDHQFVNAEIIRQGFAHLHIQPPNFKYAEELRTAYRDARAEKRGLLSE